MARGGEEAGGARTCGRGARGSPASGMCETGREETMDGPETSRRRALLPTGTPLRPLAHRRMPHPFGGHPRFGEYPRRARKQGVTIESGVRRPAFAPTRPGPDPRRRKAPVWGRGYRRCLGTPGHAFLHCFPKADPNMNRSLTIGPGYEGFRWLCRRVESRSSLEPTHRAPIAAPSGAIGMPASTARAQEPAPHSRRKER